MTTELQNTPKKLQILSPAGSAEQLVAAVNNGCDAVYLGLDSFNARMKAPNFTLDNLPQWVDYCHLFSVKVYVAINTSLKNGEFARAVELLREAYLRNVDGVIVTDLALMRIAGALPKPFEVVASTQLNVHDKYGAEFVKKCGATTVVCARECSLREIEEIASTGIGVECFLHGAMCVCQSGQCLFSSMVGGNSGNRGLCAQPCRKYYYAEGDAKSEGYLLSARDMSGLTAAQRLVEAGVTTFKIEGRNRRPEYAGMTARVYRRLFDNGFVIGNDDSTSLDEMFNRATASNRYLDGDNSDIIYPAAQNHIGVSVGKIKAGAVVASQQLCKGDGLKVFDGDREVCGGVVLENGNELVRARFDGKVCDGMSVRRTTNVRLCADVLSSKRKLCADIKFVARIGERPVVTARCDGLSVSVHGDFVVEKAVNSPVNSDEIVKQLQKSGDSYFTIRDIVCEIDDIFVAKSQINALRRRVLDKLCERLIDEYNRRFEARNSVALDVNASLCDNSRYDAAMQKNDCEKALAVICYDESGLKSAAEFGTLIYSPNIIDKNAVKLAAEYGAYIDLPSFADLDYVSTLLGVGQVGLYCNNVGQAEFARKHGLPYIAGGGLNIFNDGIAGEFADASAFVYSRELTLREIGDFTNKRGYAFVEGKIPLMQLCHCPYKVAFGCDCVNCKSDKNLVYRDELNNSFVVRRRQAGRCLFELINENKLSVVNKLKSSGRYLIDFDERVTQHYRSLNNGVDDGYVEGSRYTKGRLYNKIN